MESCNLAITISVIACEIAKGKTEEELALLRSVLLQLGETLETIAVQRNMCSSDDMEDSGKA